MRHKHSRTLSLCLAAAAVIIFLSRLPALAQGVEATGMLKDADAPSTGNPKGDVTIVEFSDYNCPFCKQSAAALEKLVKADGGIRLIHKDWPVLSEASIFGARMALAASYQGKYDNVHTALMRIPGMRISQDRMLEAIKASGVDMARLETDLKAHEENISDLLQRNAEQAEALGVQGTPAFLIGPFLAPAALDYDGFRRAVAEVRAGKKG